jgi:nitrate reductase / nitrite oxidoreductase, alpha subunit
MRLWREKRKTLSPVQAWEAIQSDPPRAPATPEARLRRLRARKLGRGDRDHRRRQRLDGAHLRPRPGLRLLADPGDVDGQLRGRLALPVAAGRHLHELLRLVLRPAAGLAHDLGRADRRAGSADWYNAGYLLLWGSNVPQTRTPDAHFYTEARYRGTKSAVICPDYSEAAKFGDIWLNAKQGTDAALGMAFGHVILREFHLDRQVPYFEDYCRKYSDMPMLVRLEEGRRLVPGRQLRAADLRRAGQKNNPDWKTVAIDENTGKMVVPNGSIGFRWGEQGKWNLEEKAGAGPRSSRALLSLILEGP